MTLRRNRLAALSCVALAWSGSCAIFPHEARLPAAALAGAGGDVEPSGFGGAGAVADGGVSSRAGSPDVGGSAGSLAGAGGDAGAALGGEGGESGEGGVAGAGGQPEPACASAVEATLAVLLDTWIEQAFPNAGHGSDARLSVVGGQSERRALVQLSLPVLPPGAVLLEASLELNLEVNSDASATKRRLALHRLLRPVSESKTTWRQFVNGAGGDWALAGGDFAAEAGEATLPAGTTSGALLIDAAPALSAVFASELEVSLLVREVGEPPSASAFLGFTSREGTPARAPRLHVRYCPP